MSSTPHCRAANGDPVGAAEGCEKVGTTFRGLKQGDRFPVDRSLRQLLQVTQFAVRLSGISYRTAAYLQTTSRLTPRPLQA
ncbi:MAG: hypothetical protein JWQ69_1669 [Pseudomonas sp.]|nr:hypothetical protein [Pseudomonas sp.]